MSLTMITGTPGSGKTLYTVSELLRPLIGQMIPVTDDDGVVTFHPRTIYSNINGLLLDHELIVGEAPHEGGWSFKDKEWHFSGNDQGLHNWHEWAKPGAVIVFDEFQKPWPPRPNGAPVPPDIQALDTHRHMGVDFILITQNPLNVDRHITGLVDRHLHVRRVANMGMAVVYEWDHASKSLLFKNSLSKSPWRYDKSAYKLYKSAKVHTKQHRKMPALVWFLAAALAGGAYLVPSAAGRIANAGKPALESAKRASAPASAASPLVPSAPLATVVSAPASDDNQVTYMGCAAFRKRCQCYDDNGRPVEVEPEVCQSETLASAPPKTGTQLDLLKDTIVLVSDLPRSAELLSAKPDRNPQDGEILRAMRRGS